MPKRVTLTESEYFKLMELRGKYQTDDLTDVLAKLSSGQISQTEQINQKVIDDQKALVERMDRIEKNFTLMTRTNDKMVGFVYKHLEQMQKFLKEKYPDFEPKPEQKQADETKQPEKQESAGSKSMFDF